MQLVLRGLTVMALVLALQAAATPNLQAAQLEPGSPLSKLEGRWVGEGRLGFKDGQTESVKCRVTYIAQGSADRLKQTVRCASSSGSIEVQSTITHAAGAISGTWSELTRNMQGDLSGQVTQRGFHVSVRGADLAANMDVVVNDARQIIEIQFHDSSLIGLTLVLTKG